MTASQVPAVSVVAGSWASDGLLPVNTIAIVPDSAAMAPVLLRVPLTRMVLTPLPAVFSMVPALVTALVPPELLSMPESDSMR